MTTAKPFQTPGDDDSADDLIAELARLMAQDAQTVQPASEAPKAQSVSPVAPVPSSAAPVRIPGLSAAAEQPRVTPAPTPAAASPHAAEPVRPIVPAQSNASGGAHMAEFVEPFRFDFGLPSSKHEAPAEDALSDAAVDHDAPVDDPVDTSFDSIADLIAAETPDEPMAEVAPPANPPETATDHVSSPVPDRPGVTIAHGRATVRVANPSVPKPAMPEQQPQGPAASSSAPGDNFEVAPIFGFGSPKQVEPAPSVALQPEPMRQPQKAQRWPQQPVEPVMAAEPPRQAVDDTLGSDPIDEIESLIGEAGRVNADRGQRPVVSAALSSLAAQPAPQPQPQPQVRAPESVRSPKGDENAVLEAARTSGAQVSWVDPVETDEMEPVAMRRGDKTRLRTSGGFLRALLGPVVAVSLLLVAGLGLYWVLGLGGPSSEQVPTLVADSTPIKAEPEIQAAEVPAPQSVVFNEIDGAAPTQEEQLVSRDQTQISEVTQSAAIPVGEDGLANRKVRTVTVRPDGTIVSGEDAVAGATILPIDRPNVPDVPGAETASPELLAAAASDMVPAPVAEATAAPVIPATPGSIIPAVDASGTPIPGKTAPVAMIRPATFANTNVPAPQAAAPTSLVNALIAPPQAATPQAAAPSVAPTVTASDAPAYVQLASQRSEEAAQQTAATLQSRYGSLFGSTALEVQRVDLGAKGIYYRVRIPANSLQAATDLCNSVKANGGDCFPL